MTQPDSNRPAFGFSRFDGRPLNTERDQQADSIRATLHAAGLRDFHVNPNDDRFSIATTSEDTRATLDDPVRFAALMTAAGYFVTGDRDDDQALLASPTDDATLPGSKFGDWGGWRLDLSAATLEHPDSEYWIELGTCTTPAEVLSWIAQASYKRLGNDDRALAGLVRALDDILHLQATLCPGGEARTLAPEQIETRIAAAAQAAPASYLV
ncbi:hypothetical protein [Kribbella sp. NPDC023855]|uniref:hypothetical protein n=1 Tax=Kribbella sp. NPDC023855 TaxID=3154698 RepID=UPI0033D5F892